MVDRPDEIIPEEQARAVWHRAAQLQAEAAQRLEERSRLLAARGDNADPSAPGFRRSDVEAAALEAGIAPELVQLALAELGSASAPPVRLTGWEDRAATRFLGTEQRSIEVSRTIAAAPRDVLTAMQRVFPAHPYFLTLRDSIGDDPLNGAILIFDVPNYWTSGTYTPLVYHSAAIDLKQLRVVLRSLASVDQPPCEVVVSSDMHFGVRRNWRVGSALSGVVGAGGAGVGALIGTKALALGAGLVALPAVAGAAVAGGLGALGYRALYRYSLRKLIAELGQLLQTLDVNARTGGAFSLPQPLRRSDGDGGATAATIASS